jgi:hypothetical protein
VLNKVTVSVLSTSRFTTVETGMVTVVRDDQAYREMLTAAQQQHPVHELVLPWSRYYNWLWRYQLGPDYPNISPKLMLDLLVPLRTPINVGVTSPLVAEVEAELIWHPFAVTTVVHLQLHGESWHGDNKLSAALDDVLRSPWAGTNKQVRNGYPLPMMSLNWDRDAASRSSRLGVVSLATFVSGLHHGETQPQALAYSLASLFTNFAADKSHPMRDSGGHLALRGQNIGLILPNSTRNAERAHRCLLANNSTLLALLQNLLTLRGGEGEYAEWYWSKAEVVLRHLYERTDNPIVGTGYKSRLAQLWLDERGYQPPP